MRTPWLVLGLAACCVFAGTPAIAADSSTALTQKALITRKLSIDLRDVPFQEALEMLTSQVGVALALDGHITAKTLRQPLTLRLRKSSVYAVLHWVFRKHQLGWAVDGREITVAPPERIDAGIRNEQMAFVARTEQRWRKEMAPRLNETRMSLDVADVPLADTIDLVAERAGLNVVWESDAESRRRQRVSLKLADVPVREILDQLTASAGLVWSLEGEAALISTKE